MAELGGAPPVFSSLVGRVIESVQYHGWTVLGVLLLVAFFKDDIRAFIVKREHAASLKSANDPERVKVLELERRRVRAEQQVRLS